MFANIETNTVWFSGLLQSDSRFKNVYNKLVSILEKHKITPKLISGTKDIWCRDYMPIQVDKQKFVQFRYEPSYLIGEPETRSDTKEVCKANDIRPVFSNINLDGGNVVNWNDRAIITDRIFDENPEYTSKSQLIGELESLLEVEIIIIPQLNCDVTGHADGMVRFVERNTVLGNNRNEELKYWTKGINKILKEHGIVYIDVPFFEDSDKSHEESAIGCYVNYLEIGELIVLPVFEVKGNKDIEAINLFKQHFPNRKIETLNFNDVGKFGGLLNCTSWNVAE